MEFVLQGQEVTPDVVPHSGRPLGLIEELSCQLRRDTSLLIECIHLLHNPSEFLLVLKRIVLLQLVFQCKAQDFPVAVSFLV